MLILKNVELKLSKKAIIFLCLPTQQVELSFQTGNEIYVYGEMDDDGFFMGELNGVRGLVPSNFLTEAPGQGPSMAQGNKRPFIQGQGPGARGPPPPPREHPPSGHRIRKGNVECLARYFSTIYINSERYKILGIAFQRVASTQICRTNFIIHTRF